MFSKAESRGSSQVGSSIPSCQVKVWSFSGNLSKGDVMDRIVILLRLKALKDETVQ